MTERLDAVEIKVNFTGARADAALAVLGLLGDGERRQIYFGEDLTGHTTLPLLDDGVILRVRRTPDGDDVTVKLRPCDRARLILPWTEMRKEDEHSFRLEEDWSGTRQVLAASLVASRDSGRLDGALAGRASPRRLFSGRHRRFLTDCAAVPVRYDRLSVLGPVQARKWDTVEWSGFEVAAERWAVADLDFLELSLRVPPEAAAAAQEGFGTALRVAGLDSDTAQETKTRLVLQRLALAHAIAATA
ncbi:MAG TPA: hypothetical protein VH502_09050 [Actinoplanes sp.]|jgi:hypothetical protein